MARSERANAAPEAEETTVSASGVLRKVDHPFSIRLKDSAAFCVTSPASLVGAGFASFGMGMFTIFRPAPVLLCSLLFHEPGSFLQPIYRIIVLVLVLAWKCILLFVLFGLGLIQAATQRKSLLHHPRGLLLLYADFFFWMTTTLTIHVAYARLHDHHSFDYPEVFFFVIYLDNCFFFLGYYAYATYFIAAELTVIERFY